MSDKPTPVHIAIDKPRDIAVMLRYIAGHLRFDGTGGSPAANEHNEATAVEFLHTVADFMDPNPDYTDDDLRQLGMDSWTEAVEVLNGGRS